MSTKLTTRLEDIMRFELFYDAFLRTRRGKGNRGEVLEFERDTVGNIYRMMEVIASGKFKPLPYHTFTVKEPKKRFIMAQPFAGRIMHQWLVREALMPYWPNHLIPTTYACIDGRGTLAAVKKARAYMWSSRDEWGPDYYIMKYDISKYFYSIDREVLVNILAEHIVDPALLEINRRIIMDDNVPSGIPVGNYTSQQYANIYLGEMDWFVSRWLGLKIVRYMDDFVIYVKDKRTAQKVDEIVRAFITEQLHLRVNPKSDYFPASQGINFAGYRIYYDYMLLRDRAKKKLKEILRLYETGKITQQEFVIKVTAWYGHARFADCANFAIMHLAPYADILPRVFIRTD